ncbi:unnamed protein product [Ilex paraguariensis]|uniref:Uncharacterized protein n=1 Tax=Ilex paraguariensis TaxID=185542 RepID=A0ABC8SQ16_9AQUA
MAPADVVGDQEDSVDEVQHMDNSGNEGSPDNGVEKVKVDFGHHAEKKEGESAVSDKTGLDTGSKVPADLRLSLSLS